MKKDFKKSQLSWDKYIKSKPKPHCKFCGKKDSQSYVCKICRNHFVQLRLNRNRIKRQAYAQKA